MLRKLVRAGVIFAILAGPAAAQERLGVPVNPKQPLSAEEIERRKATDRAYDAAMKKIPDKKPSGDPWGAIRPNGSDTSKTKQP